jgi:hypothetical protein
MSVIARYLINSVRILFKPKQSFFGLVGVTLGIAAILREHFEN